MPSYKPAPFVHYKIFLMRVITVGLYAYSLHASEGAIIYPWPAPRNVLVINNFVIYSCRNGPWYTDCEVGLHKSQE